MVRQHFNIKKYLQRYKKNTYHAIEINKVHFFQNIDERDNFFSDEKNCEMISDGNLTKRWWRDGRGMCGDGNIGGGKGKVSYGN